MDRTRARTDLAAALRRSPAVALIGPRQVGKTTLARDATKRLRHDATWFDLEDPTDLARLADPRLALADASSFVVIDEVQRRPDLFPILRVLVDAPRSQARRLLLLGSASGDLLRQSSETLAGRIAYLELAPFSIFETDDMARLWLRGGMPRAFLARSDRVAFAWLADYVGTFLERDVPSFGLRIPATALRRFWMMLAHVHGQTLNLSELGRSLDVTDKTIRHYVDVLTQTFMVRELQPWHANISKRQVKAPKVYLRDSGVLHSLLGVRSGRELAVHPKVGASWEGFALESVLRTLRTPTHECFFWATQAAAELDLLVFPRGKRIGFEFKRTDTPKTTKSIQIAGEDLALDHVFVVYPGATSFPLGSSVTALALRDVPARLAKLA
jgi:predicted AAA+ superfamily ATPase